MLQSFVHGFISPAGRPYFYEAKRICNIAVMCFSSWGGGGGGGGGHKINDEARVLHDAVRVPWLLFFRYLSDIDMFLEGCLEYTRKQKVSAKMSEVSKPDPILSSSKHHLEFYLSFLLPLCIVTLPYMVEIKHRRRLSTNQRFSPFFFDIVSYLVEYCYVLLLRHIVV